MKKKLVSALALMMSCVMLAACGGNKVEENTATPQTETSEAVTESTEEAASTETEAAGELTDVNVAALKGPTAMGMVKLMDDSDNGDTGANHYNFTIAASPDEITPQIVQGNVDIAAVPANLASVLYNKEGVDVSVLAVNTLGVLYIVENGDSVQSVADLKGKTIYASGKGATPEYALNYMLTANGIDPEKDVTIEYKSEHSECVAALAANEDAVAMLPQPFVTVAMTQNENIRVALDLTEEWEKASGDGDTKAALITGVVIARNDFIEAHPDAVETFLQQYEASVNYVNDNVADAAIVIISAGAGQKPGETRLDLVNKNVAIFKSIIPEIAKRDFGGILLVVANPVDILTQVAIKLSGLPEERVIGSGTVLDSARLRSKLGQHLSVDSRSVHAFIVGEHGDSEVVAWSSANVSGVPLSDMCEMRGHYNHKENTKEIADAVKNSAYEIINKKHATYYGIAMSVKRICEVIMRDEKSILPVSHMIHGVYEIDDVVLSMPVIVGADGIESDIPINLSGEEALKLKESADALKNIIDTLTL